MGKVAAAGGDGEAFVLNMAVWTEKLRSGAETILRAKEWVLEQQKGFGGVARARTVIEIVHEVVIGDVAVPLECWITLCCWRFAAIDRGRVSGDALHKLLAIACAAGGNKDGEMGSSRRVVPTEGRMAKS